MDSMMILLHRGMADKVNSYPFNEASRNTTFLFWKLQIREHLWEEKSTAFAKHVFLQLVQYKISTLQEAL